MEIFIARENIKRFRSLLEAAKNDTEKHVLLELLRAETEKLAALGMVEAKITTTEARPRFAGLHARKQPLPRPSEIGGPCEEMSTHGSSSDPSPISQRAGE
ncbi:hypothetical protein [Rhizobium leguminosarum]|uniref:hypothetical protein n=1 Tax=Rhizobium leguminosarum TaxID=384 RepID=UPI00143F1511|nr:hypothetical protein [Rhizobium leguminosarum]NKL22960.1 hypothetical protein [Rhizobium leguminosarum bv. viciae]NKL57278.1 hypothetical protein [Rhizobium leguminosarum bv. viciae]